MSLKMTLSRDHDPLRLGHGKYEFQHLYMIRLWVVYLVHMGTNLSQLQHQMPSWPLLAIYIICYSVTHVILINTMSYISGRSKGILKIMIH